MIPKGAKGCLVLLPLLSTSVILHVHAKQSSENPTQKNIPTQRETKQTATNHNLTSERRRRQRKKKHRSGCGTYGEDGEQGVRIELVVRGHVGETQGESQTPKGVWVSPAPEKEKKRENGADEHTEHKRRRGDNPHLGIQGSGLKGHQSKHHTNSRDKTPNNTTKNIPEQPNKETSTNPTSLGGHHTAGWRGPWAALHFWGVAPGDRGTEGSENPPTTGTAPGSARTSILPDNSHGPQKILTQLFAGPAELYTLQTVVSESRGMQQCSDQPDKSTTSLSTSST